MKKQYRADLIFYRAKALMRERHPNCVWPYEFLSANDYRERIADSEADALLISAETELCCEGCF